MEQPRQQRSRHLGCTNPKPVRRAGYISAGSLTQLPVTLDKSFFLSRPHSTFQYLLSEDYRTKHSTHAGSGKQSSMKLTELGPGNGHVAQEGFNRNNGPCTDLLQDCLEGPLKEPCAHTQIWYMGSAGRHDLRLVSRSQLHLCTELAEPPWATVAQRGGWHRPPLPQAPYGGMGGQAGTQSPLFSTPLSGTGSTDSSRSF